MTVGQLIKKLQALPLDMRVACSNGDYDGEVDSLQVLKASLCSTTREVNQDPAGQDWLFFSDA